MCVSRAEMWRTVLVKVRKLMPTTAANTVLMKAWMKRSLSARTFCSKDNVSRLRRSSNSWNFRRSRWRRPSLKTAALAKNFAVTALRPDYESLLAITTALVGVWRVRVLALLGLR